MHGAPGGDGGMLMLMLGYSTGTAAELEIHGNLQRVLDLDAFLQWISTVTGGQ